MLAPAAPTQTLRLGGVAAPNPVASGWVEPQAGCAHSSQPRSRVAAMVASRPGPCCPFALLLPTPPLPALLSHGRRQPWLCPPWAATRVAHGPPQLVPVLGATLRTTLAASCTGGCGSAWPGAWPRWLGHVFNCRLSPGWAVVLEMISKFACKPPLYPCHIFNPCWACARGRRTRFLPKCLCARDQRNHTLIQNWFKTGSKLVHHFPPKISNMSKICFDSCFRLFVVPQNCSQSADVTSFQKPEKNGFKPVSACRPPCLSAALSASSTLSFCLTDPGASGTSAISSKRSSVRDTPRTEEKWASADVFPDSCSRANF